MSGGHHGPLRVLVLHPALAPYRVDSFNALSRRTDLRLVFLEANVAYQAFDQARLREQLEVEPGYLLSGLKLGKRTLRLGIGREIARHRPEVVLTTEFGQASLAVQAWRALGGGGFAHVVHTEDNPASVPGENRLHALGRRVVLPRADGVLVYSGLAADLYRRRFGAAAPVIVSPLVQSEAVLRGRLAAAGAAAREVAAGRGLLGRRVLLSVCRLAPEKRVDRLIDAVGRLGTRLPDLALAVVGDGPERAALEARAAAQAPGRVVFAGRLEGEPLAAWYRCGTVFGLASSHEPYGAVVNEALLAGLPAVVSDRAGAQALVAPGRNGAVVDAADPAALDAALLDWLSREPPLGEAHLGAPRPSRMEATFAEAVDALVDGLQAARAWRAARKAGAAVGRAGGESRP